MYGQLSAPADFRQPPRQPADINRILLPDGLNLRPDKERAIVGATSGER
jgi:hypothetical protein